MIFFGTRISAGSLGLEKGHKSMKILNFSPMVYFGTTFIAEIRGEFGTAGYQTFWF